MNIGSKTKMIATLGPATNSKDVLKKMILAGLDVFRLNCSHGSHDDMSQIIKTIRELEVELNVNIAILVDLQGPKLRIGIVENQPQQLNENDIIYLTTDKTNKNPNTYYISYEEFAQDVKVGDFILIDDGKLKLQVLKSDGKGIVELKVIYGGPLYSKKGVNLPDTKTSLPSLTEKDKEDLLFALNHDVDWIALSFVREPQDIIYLRDYINNFGKNINIIAKIEKPEAYKNLEEIIKLSDGIMVARGDLGVEMNFNRVPIIQKQIVEMCINLSKPVIIATQMLESMITNFRPTRAEANDVANAVIDSADALMLSGETSVGSYPVETIEAMQSIIDFTEENRNIFYKNHLPDTESIHFLPDSLCLSACQLAQQTNATAIIPFTYSGYTAIRISSHRPKSEIYAFTSNKDLMRQLPLCWGITSYYFPLFDSIDKAIEHSINILKEKKLIESGDLVIHVASTPLTAKASTNMIKLTKVE